ncbi:unnamed protein product [Bursaphelenchus xylophilus]|uniref:(pine wood nematode) hypothetical protein n=1 Tax=Bursaphelenchus xylophilus TaxID=6326 RepID=A0A7I8WL27_BURXY|nr:unnamed protein product [Bursaphelenchus xylophilus]CAG9105947.1 unnamed protein product [Bursaphelenchus xylophilus]
MAKLRDECVDFLIKHLAMASYDDFNSSFAQYYPFLMVSRRYFTIALPKKLYTYNFSLDGVGYLHLKVETEDEFYDGPEFGIEFEITNEEESKVIESHRPLVTLLKLVASFPDASDHPEDFLVKLRGPDKYILPIIRSLVAAKIALEILTDAWNDVALQEFYDLASKDVTYPLRKLNGEAIKLWQFGVNAADPRVFEKVECILWPFKDSNYAPYLLNIKTQRLQTHLNLFVESDCLPSMPYLKELCCYHTPRMTNDESNFEEYYKDLSTKISNAAKNLEKLSLISIFKIYTDNFERAIQATIQVIMALHVSIRGLTSHIPPGKHELSIRIFVRDYDGLFSTWSLSGQSLRGRIDDYLEKNNITTSFDLGDLSMTVWQDQDMERFLINGVPERGYLHINPE